MTVDDRQDNLYPDIEDRLRPLAVPLTKPQIGDWLAEHVEEGQTCGQPPWVMKRRRWGACSLGGLAYAVRRMAALSRAESPLIRVARQGPGQLLPGAPSPSARRGP
jgi:hypothetical protein